MSSRLIEPGLRQGCVTLPFSKSHAHRVLIAEFLAGRFTALAPAVDDCEDVLATKRCLHALGESDEAPLDCGESGTTRRLLGPVAAALGHKQTWIMRGRLASRPQIDYATLAPGVFELPGDVSSQFASGLLFALPRLKGDSEIRFTTPLRSRGYVEMTCAVLRAYGICVEATATGFRVPGRQIYRAPATIPEIERDWSGAAFWLAANALGNRLTIEGLTDTSCQPDRRIAAVLANLPQTIDMEEFPDSFPILSLVAAARAGETQFTGIARLRLKECDRVAAMEAVLTRLGRAVKVSETTFCVVGEDKPFKGGTFQVYNDHRIAMTLAIAATRSEAALVIDNPDCVAKSYPQFWETFSALRDVARLG